MAENVEKEYLDRVFHEFVAGAQKIYPYLKYNGRYSIYNTEFPVAGELKLGTSDYLLKNTKHDAGENKMEIIHFTSLKAGLGILESGELWLSQIGKCNDVRELNHAFSGYKDLSLEELDLHKQKFFLTSFCINNHLTEEDEFAMWRSYGKDGYGLALIFEVEKPNTDIQSYLFGKVVYGERTKAMLDFRAFMSYQEHFRKKYPGVIQNKYFHQILMVALLLKTAIWKREKEIRLLGFHDFDEYTLKTKTFNMNNSLLGKMRHTLDEDGTHRAFLRLPLYRTKQFSEYQLKIKELDPGFEFSTMLPHLQLKKVVLGYRMLNKFSNEMEIVLRNNLSNFDNKPTIASSRLRKYF